MDRVQFSVGRVNFVTTYEANKVTFHLYPHPDSFRITVDPSRERRFQINVLGLI